MQKRVMPRLPISRAASKATDGKTGDSKNGDSKPGDARAADPKSGAVTAADGRAGNLKATDLVTGVVKAADLTTDRAKAADVVRQCEQEADEVRRILISELNRTFVTPFDREDISALSRAIDDIMDYAWTTVKEMEMLHVTPTPYLQRMVSLLQEAAREVHLAMLRIKDHPALASEHAQRAKALENRVETVYVRRWPISSTGRRGRACHRDPQDAPRSTGISPMLPIVAMRPPTSSPISSSR